MHSVHVSSQLLVPVLFIVVPTNTENFKFFITLVCVLFLASVQLYSYAHTIENLLFLYNNNMAMIWWLDYIKCNLLLFVFY